jgi:hypothetical protein
MNFTFYFGQMLFVQKFCNKFITLNKTYSIVVWVFVQDQPKVEDNVHQKNICRWLKINLPDELNIYFYVEFWCGNEDEEQSEIS